MVLWELTAITAYFLGLKRTYRLSLRLQRRLIGPNHPRIRHFVYRFVVRSDRLTVSAMKVSGYPEPGNLIYKNDLAIPL
ncbi:hypothetical protein ABZP36_021490 [Zizania latifolia]